MGKVVRATAVVGTGEVGTDGYVCSPVQVPDVLETEIGKDLEAAKLLTDVQRELDEDDLHRAREQLALRMQGASFPRVGRPARSVKLQVELSEKR